MKKTSIRSFNDKDVFATIELLAEDKETGFSIECHTLMPGFKAQKHLHTDFEWVHVLKGELRDEEGSYPQGTLKINAKDSVHTPYTQTGCTLLVFTRAKRIPVK